MKILLHQCCGPCSIFPIEVLGEKNFEITAYFFNPNIHPIHEFYMRLNGAIDVAKYYDINIIVSENYGLEYFLDKEFYEKSKRCSFCYDFRIEATAKLASEMGFDFFTTSLLYSKYQNHNEITDLCEKYSNKYNVNFYYYDFREGWKRGIEKSKEIEIYRQQYCGCIFSEEERYKKQLKNQLSSRISSLNNAEAV